MASITHNPPPFVALTPDDLPVEQHEVYGRLASNIGHAASDRVVAVVDSCRNGVVAGVQGLWNQITVSCPTMVRNCGNYVIERVKTHKNGCLLTACGISALYFNSKVLTGVFVAHLAVMYTDIGERAWNKVYASGSRAMNAAVGVCQSTQTAYRQAYTGAENQIRQERVAAAKQQFITHMQSLRVGTAVSEQDQASVRSAIYQMPFLLQDQEVLAAINTHPLGLNQKHPLWADRGFLCSLLTEAPAAHKDRILRLILTHQQYTTEPTAAVGDRQTFFTSLLTAAPSEENFRLLCTHLSQDKPDREVFVNQEFAAHMSEAMEPVYTANGGADRAVIVQRVKSIYGEGLQRFGLDNREMAAINV